VCGKIKIILRDLLTVAYQIYSSSDLYLEESGYPLNCLVCMHTYVPNSSSQYELILLSNCNTPHLFADYVCTASD